MAFSQKRSEAMKRRWKNAEYKNRMSIFMKENNPMKKEENAKKLSIIKTGIKRPYLSEKYKGKGNPNYRSGLITGKRKVIEIKKVCEVCSSEKNLEVHHIDEDRTNNELSNLKLLCKSCHSKEHRGNEWHNMMYHKRLIKMEVNN